MRVAVMEQTRGDNEEKTSAMPQDGREKIEKAIQRSRNTQTFFGERPTFFFRATK